MTLGIDSIEGLNLFDVFQAVLGFIAPPMSVVFLTGVLWKKMTTKGANFILAGGTVISIGTGIFYLWIFPSAEYDFWPHFLLLSFYIFAFLLFLAWIIASLDKAGQKEIKDFDMSGIEKPSKTVWVMWIALILVMVCLYVFFNGH
jgi:solute:Na+ symporter, SSS family